MININISKGHDRSCNECGEYFEELNIIELNDIDVHLCETCLQGLNKTIVENLVDKYL